MKHLFISCFFVRFFLTNPDPMGRHGEELLCGPHWCLTPGEARAMRNVRPLELCDVPDLALFFRCLCCCSSVNAALFKVAGETRSQSVSPQSLRLRHSLFQGPIKTQADAFYRAEIRESGGCQHFLAHCVAKIYEATIRRPLNSLSTSTSSRCIMS